MLKVFHRLQKTIVLATLVTFLMLLPACSHHGKKNSSSWPSNQSTKNQLALVEQQLLTTIKNAEDLGQGNPLLLSILYSLANYYHERKEYEKAADQYQRALHIKEHISGPNHPDIVAILQRYAGVLQDAKRPTQAANLLARANAILAQSQSFPTSQ